MRMSSAGLQLVKDFEGYHTALPDGRCQAYRCPAGVWTIGWGCTEGVHEGLIWTREEAEVQLRFELQRFEAAVVRLVTVPLNQNQFDALVSFAYNIGDAGLAKSTLLRKLNNGDYRGAAAEFRRWNRGGGRVLPGLVDRRAREATLFLTPMAPSVTAGMPQAVEPSAPIVSRTEAGLAVGAVALVPAVPDVINGTAGNAEAWLGIGTKVVGMGSLALSSPLAVCSMALIVVVWTAPRWLRGRS